MWALKPQILNINIFVGKEPNEVHVRGVSAFYKLSFLNNTSDTFWSLNTLITKEEANLTFLEFHHAFESQKFLKFL